METIVRHDITNEAQLDSELIRISRENPKSWVTYYVTFGVTRIFIHKRKPGNTNVAGAEDCYRHYGGFFKNGEIFEPSNTWVKQFSFCPVLG